MKHYVVIEDWATDLESNIDVFSVEHTLEDAQNKFKEVRDREKSIADEKGYKTYEDNDRCFDAGEDGYYIEEHTRVYIIEV